MIQFPISGLIINNLDKLKEISRMDEDKVLKDGWLFTSLKKYNIHLIFAPLFEQHKEDKRIAIIKTSYIILCYTNHCTWLNFKQDRYINKKEILSSLIHDSGLMLEDEHIETMIRNTDPTMCDVIDTYIMSQKDDMFVSLVAYAENIALGRRIAMENTKERTARDATGITDNLNKLRENERYYHELLRQIKTTYSDMDELTRMEGKAIFTDELDLTIYENRLKYKMANKLYLENNE